MAKIRITLDKRKNSESSQLTFPVVFRISHKSKTRDIGLGISVKESNFKSDPLKITGISNSVRKTKQILKLYSEIDLWLESNKGVVRVWTMNQLKDYIEKNFLKKQSNLTLLTHGAKVLSRLKQQDRFSTASSYEDALKVFVKFQLKKLKKDDLCVIKTLYQSHDGELSLKDEFSNCDIALKAFTVELAKDFRSYLGSRYKSRNSIGIYLRSIQAIMNDAEETYEELRGHKPLEKIKKSSQPNSPVVLSPDEINKIRLAKYDQGTPQFHVKNIFLFMYNNMGMNFFDVVLAKVNQFDGERFNYSRKKTSSEGDFFSILQSEENKRIIKYYSSKKEGTKYLFSLIPEEAKGEAIFKKKKEKLKWFNDHLKKIARDLEINKNVSSYTARDTWTNIGLSIGVDIRKISTGLGHSSVEVTEKHYSQKIMEKILDEINAQITNT